MNGITEEQVKKFLADTDHAIESHKKRAVEIGVHLSEWEQGYIRGLTDCAKEIRRLSE
jgi:hypothetical protein